jgi:serine/threonine-protein kinase
MLTIAAGTHPGRYEIRSQLGKGGMGEVYLTEDLRLHRKVALKILPAEVALNQERVRRFNQVATLTVRRSIHRIARERRYHDQY